MFEDNDDDTTAEADEVQDADAEPQIDSGTPEDDDATC
jgi:hypothetical protein